MFPPRLWCGRDGSPRREARFLRELQRRRRARELPFPVVEVFEQNGPAHLLALPCGKISVLDRKLAKGCAIVDCAVVLRNRIISSLQFAAEDSNGPSIGNDVVHGHEQDRSVLGYLQET